MIFFRDEFDETEQEYQKRVRKTFYDVWKERLEACTTVSELDKKEIEMLGDLDKTLSQAVGLEPKYRLALIEVSNHLQLVISRNKEKELKCHEI